MEICEEDFKFGLILAFMLNIMRANEERFDYFFISKYNYKPIDVELLQKICLN